MYPDGGLSLSIIYHPVSDIIRIVTCCSCFLNPFLRENIDFYRNILEEKKKIVYLQTVSGEKSRTIDA